MTNLNNERFEALEIKHLGDSKKETGIYAPKMTEMHPVVPAAPTVCKGCDKMIPPTGDYYCAPCLEQNRKDHLENLQRAADKYFEGLTKEQAIERLCAFANGHSLSMFDTWIYSYGVERFGITRGDYYNDYEELTEEARNFISDNWKINTGTPEERFARLEQDLIRELGSMKKTPESLLKNLEEKRYTYLSHYATHITYLGELIAAMQELKPRDGGRKIWEM